MKTITFYSYKGGVGRTLLLANLAKYLCRFGRKVFALDFDLEAPGLHYKLTTPESRAALAGRPGVVDYIYSFVAGQERPHSLSEYTLEVERRDDVEGIIRLMPAGDVPSAEYWRRLARINWHDMVYTEGARGIPFFLELKAKIETEFAPDYLLIDSRTGITEIAGIATTVLADTIVCLLLGNAENLEGAREVLRSIRRTRRARGQEPAEVVPVLSRLPGLEGADEAELLESVRAFLNQDAANIEDSVRLTRVFALHTERSLEEKESLLIESGADAESLLLRDYIHLIAQLVPREELTPHIVSLVHQAMVRAWDDPDGAEKTLIALCEHSTIAAPFQALLKFYRQMRADKTKILDLAVKYWRACARTEDPLLLGALRDNFTPATGGQLPLVPIEFVEAVWRADGARDSFVGVQLAHASFQVRQCPKACMTIETLLTNDAIPDGQAGGLLGIAVKSGCIPLADRLIARYKHDLEERARTDPEISGSWLTTIAKIGDKQRVLDFLDGDCCPGSVGLPTLMQVYKILIEAERTDASLKIRQLLLELNLPIGLVHGPAHGLDAFWEMVDRLDLEKDLRTRLSTFAEYARKDWELILRNRPRTSRVTL